MSNLENKKQEETPKKRPYNLREKKEKKAAYRSLIRPELADELYDKILNIVVVQKKYRDPDYSAKDLAKELKTNTRYLSAVVNSRFGQNYSCLLNEYRVKDALHLLTDKRYADKNVEEISAMVGFANRQSFYAAFYKNVIEWEQKKKLFLRGDTVLLNDSVICAYRFKENYYFVTGDKVMNSQDSRYWGLLPEPFIVGKAVRIWKSVDRNTDKIRWNRIFKKIE